MHIRLVLSRYTYIQHLIHKKKEGKKRQRIDLRPLFLPFLSRLFYSLLVYMYFSHFSYFLPFLSPCPLSSFHLLPGPLFWFYLYTHIINQLFPRLKPKSDRSQVPHSKPKLDLHNHTNIYPTHYPLLPGYDNILRLITFTSKIGHTSPTYIHMHIFRLIKHRMRNTEYGYSPLQRLYPLLRIHVLTQELRTRCIPEVFVFLSNKKSRILNSSQIKSSKTNE